MSEIVVTLIIAIFGSTGFWAFVSQKFSKRAELLESVEGVKAEVKCIRNDMAINNAKNSRVRIITFADGLRTGNKYSKDAFDTILLDCDEYEKFCDGNKNFKNSVADSSIKRIKKHYEEDDFLSM